MGSFGGFSWRERRVPLASCGTNTIVVFVIVTL